MFKILFIKETISPYKPNSLLEDFLKYENVFLLCNERFEIFLGKTI